MPGVKDARSFVSHTVQREHRGRPLRMMIQGLSWPSDRGQWLPIVSGRALHQAHYEMIADVSTGLSVGDRVPLGSDVYVVVGLTQLMTSQSGDPMAFLSLTDAQVVQFDLSGEEIRVEREARLSRLAALDLYRTQPQTEDRAVGPSKGIPALGTSIVSAILVNVLPGHASSDVTRRIAGWPDVSVYSQEEQRQLLLRGSVDRARRQIGLFTVILVVVSAVIMALILYTLTLDKIHDIAMLKLMGARNTVILALILEQALLLGALGLGFAWVLGKWIFPYFPRRVVVLDEDLARLAAIVLAISFTSSVLGIGKALRVQPNEVLS